MRLPYIGTTNKGILIHEQTALTAKVEPGRRYSHWLHLEQTKQLSVLVEQVESFSDVRDGYGTLRIEAMSNSARAIYLLFLLIDFSPPGIASSRSWLQGRSACHR